MSNDVRMIVAARSDVGRARTNNEDAFTITDLATGDRVESGPNAGAIDVLDKGVLLALSDGMGGHQAGEVASQLVLDSLRAAMEAEGGGSMDQKIEAAVRRANADVALAARSERKKGMGATLTAIFVHADDAYVAEVGDSRAYLLRSGKIRQMTKDQSLVQMLVDNGVLSMEQAKRSPHKNVILQAMGLADDVRVAIGRLKLRREDRMLLYNDGLSNAISDDEFRVILGEMDPTSACQRLIDLANDRGGEDNLTAIVAHFDGDGLPAAMPTESITTTFEVLKDFLKDMPVAQEEAESVLDMKISPIKPASRPTPAASSTAQTIPPAAAAATKVPTSPPTPPPPVIATTTAKSRAPVVVGAIAVLLVALVVAFWFVQRGG
jgi:serine/threonine protein phosphatase PrpC